MKVYLGGSLANPKVRELAMVIREHTGSHVFDAWAAAHPQADECWREYSIHSRNQAFEGAVRDHAGQQVFNFDRLNLLASDVFILVLPCGKSGHLEAGYMAGLREAGFGKKVYVFTEGDPDRYDVMYAFFDAIVSSMSELLYRLKEDVQRYKENGRV